MRGAGPDGRRGESISSDTPIRTGAGYGRGLVAPSGSGGLWPEPGGVGASGGYIASDVVGVRAWAEVAVGGHPGTTGGGRRVRAGRCAVGDVAGVRPGPGPDGVGRLASVAARAGEGAGDG